MPVNSTDAEANASGIETRENIRAALIELRGQKLDTAEFGEAVLLSHAIWWLAPALGDLILMASDDDVDGDGMRLGDTAWNEEEG